MKLLSTIVTFISCLCVVNAQIDYTVINLKGEEILTINCEKIFHLNQKYLSYKVQKKPHPKQNFALIDLSKNRTILSLDSSYHYIEATKYNPVIVSSQEGYGFN